jgi:polysaccharide export outer membrane protein
LRGAFPASFALALAACTGSRSASNLPHAPEGYRTGPPPAYAYLAPPEATPPVIASPGPPIGTVPVRTSGLGFRLEPGDEVATSVWKEPELASQQRILADGTISPPLLRVTPVVGLTVDELQDRLTSAYAEYLREPKVSVRLVAIHSDRAFVLGEVRNPQAVLLTGPTTLVEAISMAGGFWEEFAEKRRVHLVRRGLGGAEVTYVDARAILEGQSPDVPLHRGDVVFVPARGVTEWARTVGQALAPLSTALGTAGAVVTVQQATR